MRCIRLETSLTNPRAEGRQAPCSSIPAASDETQNRAGDAGRSYFLERVFLVPFAKSASDAVLHFFPWLNKHMPAKSIKLGTE
jgi:hypothetical protein